MSKNTQPVIFKGFMNEPKRLISVGIDKLFVTVLGISGKTQMRLKIKYVYQHNEKLYRKLTEMYSSKNYEGLERAWQEAKPITT